MNEHAEDEQLEPGFILGKYRIVRFISEGSMGRVYEAEHTILHSRHALKVIRKFLAMNQYFISKFRYEARLMAALEHENIVRVTDYGQDKGFSFFVLDFIRGPNGEPLTLQSKINRLAGKGMDEAEVKEIALQICDALAYAHSFRGEGIVHRDLKPGNILLRDVGKKHLRVVVTDFGLARMLTLDDSLQSMVVLGDGAQGTIVVSDGAGTKIKTDEISGTPAYMAPEQWTPGAEIGPASDLYSLGAMLYKQLTGEMPYIDSRSLIGERNEGPLARPSSFGVSKAWDPILAKCLEAKASDRFTTAAELRVAIAAIGERKPSSGLFAKAVGLILLAGLAAGAGWLYLDHQKNPEGSMLSQVLPPQHLDTPAIPEEAHVEVVALPTPTSAPTAVPPTPTPLPPENGRVEIALTLKADGASAPYTPGTARLRAGASDWKMITLPFQMEWPAGKDLDLELEVKGFHVTPPKFRQVKKDEQQQLLFEVEPAKVPVRFTSNVPEAALYMKNKLLGKEGGVIQLEPFQNHVLEFRAEGYNSEQIFLDALDPSRDYAAQHVQMKAIPAQLQISGNYPAIVLGDRKVNIYMNDRLIGNHMLPHYIYNVVPGDYDLRIEGEDWQTIEPQTVSLDRAAVGQVTFQLKYKNATVDLKVTPPEAELTLSGQKVGQEKLSLPPGLYKLQASADAYETKTVAINLKPGEVEEVSLSLNRMTLLDFKVTPADASIYMRGAKIKPGRVAVRPDSAYLVTIKADGYKTHQESYTVRPGELKVVDVKLKKKFF